VIREREHLLEPPAWEEEEERRGTDDSSWLIIYLDVFTLMLSVFVMLLSYTTYAPEKYDELTRTLAETVTAEAEKKIEAEPLREEKEQQAAIAQPAEESMEKMEESFRQAIIDQDLEQSVEITVEANRVNLQIRENILFRLGKADLTGTGREVLGKLVSLLNSGGNAISVEGHTDPIPISNRQFPSNWELSTERATTVLRYLISQGVVRERLRAIGYADTRPLADNATDEGRARNRRVALVVHMQEE
jgi:chemotaxis protein MotB